MSLIFLPDANEEMYAAAEWYELGKTGLGFEFLEEVSGSIDLIQRHRRAGRQFPGMTDEVRLVPLNRFPYQLIYRLRRQEITVVAISHNSRRPDS